MKLFLLLINIIYIFSLTLSKGINIVNNTSNISKDCQIYYSIIGKENGKCHDNSYDSTGCVSFAKTKNGHITEL